jgi:hypothetical protein
MILSQGYPSPIPAINIAMSAIAYPTPRRPSQIGVDLSEVYPKSSQIGVQFREQALIGVGFKDILDPFACAFSYPLQGT